MADRLPIGCDAKAACAYLGCTENRLKELQNVGVVRTIGNGWYSYRLLDEAMDALENRSAGDKVLRVHDDKTKAAKGHKGQKPKSVPGVGDRSGYPGTEALLRSHERESFKGRA